jgi:acid stress chaperone HdeB
MSTKTQAKGATIVVNDPDSLKGALKNTGGSRSDHWNSGDGFLRTRPLRKLCSAYRKADGAVVGADLEGSMRKILPISLLPVFVCATSVYGQVVIDVAKITCDQFVYQKVSTPKLVGAWLSGYYHAKAGSLSVDLTQLEENINKLQKYCFDEKNSKVPILKAVEQAVRPGE